MAEQISTPNPVAQPNVNTANQTAAKTDPGFTSSDASVQAKIAEMRKQAVAKSSQAPTPAPTPATPAVATPVNTQGLTPTQMSSVASTGAKPGTVTGTVTPQVGTQPQQTTYQTYTAEQRMQQQVQDAALLQTGKSRVADLTDQDIANAKLRIAQSNASQSGQVALPAPGVSYDPSIGKYKDSLSGMYFQGFNPQGGLMFTPDESLAMDTIFNSPQGGILTSDESSAGVGVMGNVIQRAMSTPLPHAGQTTPSGQRIDPKTGLAITTSSQKYDQDFDSEMAPILNEIDNWKNFIANSATQESNLIAAQRIALLERKAAFIGDIHAQAKAEYDSQVVANEKANAKVKTFFARTGMIGSSQELQFVADTIREGESALRAIADSERKAVNEAQFQYEQQDYQLAREKLQVAKEAREQYQTLFFKQAEIKQSFEQMAMQREQHAAQMMAAADDREIRQLELQGKREEVGMKKISNLLSAGYELNEDTAPEFMQIAKDLNWTPRELQSYVSLTKGAMEAQELQNEEERRTKELDNANKLVAILDKVPIGQAIEIGGTKYYGTSRGDIKSGTEVDGSGNVTYWEFNPSTKQVESYLVGEGIGRAEDGWDTQFDDQGRMWFINPSQQRAQPAFPSQGQRDLDSVIPDGSVWQRDGQPAPQCGQFVNDICGAGVGDSFDSKMAKTDSSIQAGTNNPPRYGDFFVQELNTWTGHIGMVVGTEQLNGETYIITKESNYPKPGVISSRKIPASQIDGFGRTGQLHPAFTVGPDSLNTAPAAVPGSTSGQPIPTFGNKPITPTTIGNTYQDQLSTLESSKGSDGFVNTDAYKSLRAQYDQDDERQAFDANFSHLLNPKDATAKPFLKESGNTASTDTGRSLDSGQAKLLAEGQNLENVLTPVRELLGEKNLFGPLTGRINQENILDSRAQDAQARLKRATQIIGSYLEGGVLRAEDEVKYRNMLPQLTDTEATARKKLEGVERLVKDKQREYLDSYENAGYDVSPYRETLNSDSPVTSSEKIRVRRKANGKEYMIDEAKFNPNIFDRV